MSEMAWNAVDLVLLAVLLFSALVGLWRGLVYEVLSMAAWVIAFVLAQRYASEVALALPLEGLVPSVRTAVGFTAVFIGCAFAGGMVAWLVKKMVAVVGLRPIDRLLGGGFGLLRGAVVLLAVAVVVGLSPLKSNPLWLASSVAQVLVQCLSTLRPLLPETVANHLT